MIFDNHEEVYNEALHNSGHKNELKYLGTKRHYNDKDNNLENHKTKNDINMNNMITKNINKNRFRNIIWFNPPFWQTLKPILGNMFLGLINIFKKLTPWAK